MSRCEQEISNENFANCSTSNFVHKTFCFLLSHFRKFFMVLVSSHMKRKRFLVWHYFNDSTLVQHLHEGMARNVL